MRLSTTLLAIAPAIASAQTLGVTHYDPANAEGYVLFAPIPSTTTYLIDKCGHLVHTWPSNFRPGQSVYLLNDGDLLHTGAPPNSTFNSGGRGGRIERIAWNGALEWSYTISNTTECAHHDVHPMPNGNVLVIVWELHTIEEAIAAGRDPSLLAATLWSEKILELEPVGSDQANVVWEWHLWDHLVQDFDASKPGYGVVSEHPELLDLNHVPGNITVDWIHANAIDYNAELDQVILSSHNMSEVWVIDHSTTTAEAASHTGGAHNRGGDFLYRWGNPQVYERGDATDQVYFGQHNVQWIPNGIPRAGEILVFNNGLGRPGDPYSTIDVFVPDVDENGDYVIGSTEPFGPAVLDFSWSATPPTSFYAQNISGAQALPNGGFIACAGPQGAFVEIDADGNEVWRYVSPVNMNGPMTQGDLPAGNTVFRCTWIAADDPRLNGLALVAGDPIELQPAVDPCLATSLGSEGQETSGVMVTPSATDGSFTVSGPALGDRLDLWSANGTCVRTWTMAGTTSTIPAADLPCGVYVLSIMGAEGRTIARVPVVH